MTEAECVTKAEWVLRMICSDVEREYQFEVGEQRFRADLKGVLPNGEYVLVESKAFDATLTPYVDAIVQAASYAAAITYPVFVGPIEASRTDLAAGRLDNAIGALHLMAGRFNVGFLCTYPRNGGGGLFLRGQRLTCNGYGLHSQFDHHWGYIERVGSKRVRK